MQFGPFVLKPQYKKIESDLAYAGLNSDHVGVKIRTEFARQAANLPAS